MLCLTCILPSCPCSWDNVVTKAPSDNDRPLGVQGHSAVAIGRHIYYVGGYCGHGTCYHNSIHRLEVDDMEWKCISPSSDQVPMLKKAYFCLVPFDGEILLSVGGFGRYKHASLPEGKYSYEEDASDYVFTNEHTMYNINSGEFKLQNFLYIYLSLSRFFWLAC